MYSHYRGNKKHNSTVLPGSRVLRGQNTSQLKLLSHYSAFCRDLCFSCHRQWTFSWVGLLPFLVSSLTSRSVIQQLDRNQARQETNRERTECISNSIAERHKGVASTFLPSLHRVPLDTIPIDRVNALRSIVCCKLEQVRARNPRQPDLIKLRREGRCCKFRLGLLVRQDIVAIDFCRSSSVRSVDDQFG